MKMEFLDIMRYNFSATYIYLYLFLSCIFNLYCCFFMLFVFSVCVLKSFINEGHAFT